MKNIFMRPVDFMPKYNVSYTQFMNGKLETFSSVYAFYSIVVIIIACTFQVINHVRVNNTHDKNIMNERIYWKTFIK